MFEKVNPSHPDKIADRIAGAIVDLAYERGSLAAGTVAGAYSPAKSCVRTAVASSGARFGTPTIHTGRSSGGATGSMKKGTGFAQRRMSGRTPSKQGLCR